MKCAHSVIRILHDALRPTANCIPRCSRRTANLTHWVACEMNTMITDITLPTMPLSPNDGINHFGFINHNKRHKLKIETSNVARTAALVRASRHIASTVAMALPGIDENCCTREEHCDTSPSPQQRLTYSAMLWLKNNATLICLLRQTFFCVQTSQNTNPFQSVTKTES